MKALLAIICVMFFSFASVAQQTHSKPAKPVANKKIQTVDAACGQCQFGLKGKGCSLAVRIKGKAYFVDGSDIDSHGDAHASDGFCNAVRTAEVQGGVVNNRFKITYFKLIEKPGSGEEKKNQ
jgi:hypothetical protein